MITFKGVMDNEQVYRNHCEELTRYATGLVGPFDAPDVVTDACLRAFGSRNWRDVVDHRAYLYRTVTSVATDHHRRTLSRRLRESRAATPEAIEIAPADFDVLAAVARLSMNQRAVVFLTYWEDLTPAAAGERLGITEGSVKRHLARARKRLGEMLA